MKDLLHAYDAVFFDAGMTLLAPSVPIHEVYLGAARHLGVDIPPAEFMRHHGSMWKRVNEEYRSATADLVSSDAHEREAWRRFTLAVAEPFPELAARHAEWLPRLIEHFDAAAGWRPIPGAHELLAALRARGTIVGVVSNWHTALHGILAAHGLARHCDFVLTSAEAGRKKPHPEIFRTALTMAGLEAGRAAHVGDSLHDDAEGALAAGIAPFLLAPPTAAPLDSRIVRVETLAELMQAR
jgi:REG-2-like HAD superfamily hydrolase